MASIPFVDTHVHYWDLRNPSLRYDWLMPEWVHPVLGNIDAIKVQRYMAQDFIAETRFQNVSKAIHVQAAIGIADPVEETRWLQAQADATGFPHGIVAHCDLASPDAQKTIERHLESPNLRGVRDFGQGDYLTDPAWERGYALLAQYGLVFCIDPTLETMAKARALADRNPDVVLSIDHAGYPHERTPEYFELWRRGMGIVAGAPNVICKISGLGMRDNDWTVDSWRPWVHSCLDMFGIERSFFGTNWPVDRQYSSYGDVLDAYDVLTSDLTGAEREALFSANAERIFSI